MYILITLFKISIKCTAVILLLELLLTEMFGIMLPV